MSRGLAAKVSHSTIEGAVAGAVSLDEVPRSCAAQDCGDRSRAFPALEMGGEEGVVAREELVEDRIGFVAIGLDVDEQDESCFVRIDITPISTCALGQGFEVEFLKSAVLADSESGVGDMKLFSPQEDVGLHTAESLFQSIEERTLVVVVVVGVGPGQGGYGFVGWHPLVLCPAGYWRNSESEDKK